MNKQIVKGVWFRDLVIYVGDDVYWSVILCLIFLCFSGIYFAIVGPLSDVPKWILIFLFSLLFFAAGSNQRFIWRLYIPGQIKSNKFIAYSMYADRLIALGILVLGIIYFEESGSTWLQVLLFFNALLFYACLRRLPRSTHPAPGSLLPPAPSGYVVRLLHQYVAYKSGRHLLESAIKRIFEQ